MHPAGTLAAGVATVLLVAFSTVSPEAAVIALVASLGLAGLMALGPDRLGTGLVLLGMGLAPMQELQLAGQVTVSDVVLVAGFGCLVPTMLLRRTRLPIAFAAGAFLLLVMCVVASLLSPTPTGSLFLSVRLLAASVVMPLAFLLWRPDALRLRQLAWAYVAGQVLSTLVALAEGPVVGNRYAGVTGHPNVYAISGLVAMALVLYLWHETQRRWLVVLAGVVCLASISMSGSRGALLAVVLVGALYPVVERSAASTVLVLAAATLTLPALRWVADSLTEEGSALQRLLHGDETSGGSDSVRRQELLDAVDRFLMSPVVGNGLDEKLLHPHNIFLQIAVAIGVLGLAAWLLMISPMVTVLFADSPARRLGYVTLAYFAIGMTQPSLWERNVWAALCLAAVAAVTRREDSLEDSPEGAQPSAALATTPHAPEMR